MRIYLDNCCYNRPYDDQRQLRISLETQAKLHIQENVRKGNYELVTSFVLRYEISRNPHTSPMKSITEYIDLFTSIYVSAMRQKEVEIIAEDIQKTGVKKMDSWQVACAILAEADYFLTTDKRLLKYRTDKIKLINPVDFISEMEELV